MPRPLSDVYNAQNTRSQHGERQGNGSDLEVTDDEAGLSNSTKYILYDLGDFWPPTRDGDDDGFGKFSSQRKHSNQPCLVYQALKAMSRGSQAHIRMQT